MLRLSRPHPEGAHSPRFATTALGMLSFVGMAAGLGAVAADEGGVSGPGTTAVHSPVDASGSGVGDAVRAGEVGDAVRAGEIGDAARTGEVGDQVRTAETETPVPSVAAPLPADAGTPTAAGAPAPAPSARPPRPAPGPGPAPGARSVAVGPVAVDRVVPRPGTTGPRPRAVRPAAGRPGPERAARRPRPPPHPAARR